MTKHNFWQKKIPATAYGGPAGWAMAEMGYISGISGPILKIIFFTEKHWIMIFFCKKNIILFAFFIDFSKKVLNTSFLPWFWLFFFLLTALVH